MVGQSNLPDMLSSLVKYYLFNCCEGNIVDCHIPLGLGAFAAYFSIQEFTDQYKLFNVWSICFSI
jgi:hypothetical protein